ncbi:MAG: YARHG domain-containing protein [Clostridium sp.]|nr:YARHG domain-containing protein [Clostridium sp.]
MICPICKTEIKDDSKFCAKCGSRIPRCPVCGKVFYRKVRFCTEDGTPIPEELFEGLSEFREAEAPPPKQHQKMERPQAAEVSRNPKRPKKKKKVFLILGILLLVGAGGYLGYSAAGNIAELISKFSGDGHGEEEAESSESETTESTENETKESAESETEEETEESLPLLSAEEASSEAETEAAAADPVVYFIMNCDKMYFTREDLLSFDAEMCRMARNGIYARLGRAFKDEVLNSYFTQFDWYVPVLSAEEFSETLLNQYQIANRDLIVAYEREMGY